MNSDSDSSQEAARHTSPVTISVRVSKQQRKKSGISTTLAIFSEIFYVIELITGTALYRYGFHKFHQGWFGQFLAILMKLKKNAATDKYAPLNIWPLVLLPFTFVIYHVENTGNYQLARDVENAAFYFSAYLLIVSIFSAVWILLQKFFEKIIFRNEFPKSLLHKAIRKKRKMLYKKLWPKCLNQSEIPVSPTPYALLPTSAPNEPEDEIFNKEIKTIADELPAAVDSPQGVSTDTPAVVTQAQSANG